MSDQLATNQVSLDDLRRAIDAYEDIPLDFHHAGESNAALAKAWQTAFDWREQWWARYESLPSRSDLFSALLKEGTEGTALIAEKLR